MTPDFRYYDIEDVVFEFTTPLGLQEAKLDLTKLKDVIRKSTYDEIQK